MLSLILLILSIVVPILVPLLIHMLKIDLPQAKQEELIKLIEMAIRYAEEYSRTNNVKGTYKEDLAIEYLRKNGIKIETNKLRMMIKAVLSKLRGF